MDTQPLGNGAELHFLGGNCPVYGEGTVDGRTFSFSARGTTLRFACGAYTASQPYTVDDAYVASIQAYNAEHGRAALDADTIRGAAAGWISEEAAKEAIQGFIATMRA